MCLVDPKKRYRQQEKIRLPFFSSFIYANNEPKSALAQDFGDCHDNKFFFSLFFMKNFLFYGMFQ